MGKNNIIYILSDSVGETGEQVAMAAIGQFSVGGYETRKFPYITEKEQIMEILEEAQHEKCIIVYTIVIDELKRFLEAGAGELGIKTIDLMSPIIEAIKELVGIEPKKEAGTIRKLDADYFKKIEAVEFAVKYDDGKDNRGVKKADIVLVGISRTSKTPLSMYLAHKNLKVANVPLVPEVPVPDELFEVDINKVIGLTANPIKLNEIRQERLKALGLNDTANYASMDRILKEIEYSENLIKRLGCPMIDVSNKAVEETAGIILEITKHNSYGGLDV